jgi:5-methylthioadenosine/S-adenosylhomocysteine deaminase
MNTKPLLFCPRWLVPVVPHNTNYRDYAVLVERGKISAIGPREELIVRHPDAERIELNDHVLLPGFINAHTHAAMSLLRGIADDLPLETWLHDHIWPAEAKWVDEQFIEDGSELAIAEMLSGGTTCFSDMYFFPELTAKVAQEMGIRAVVGSIVLDFPTIGGDNADEYIAKGLTLHDELQAYSNVYTSFAPHSPYAVSDEPLLRVQTLADELQIPIHIHVHETEHEVNESLALHEQTPLDRLEDLGLLTPRLVTVHMTLLDDVQINKLAEFGVSVVHCPESNMKLASGICPVSKLLEADVNVALGTDGAASNNDLCMFGEMRSASLLAKVSSGDASALPAWQALEMATINGAKALNLDSEIGSIEVGKAADMIAVNLSSFATSPVYDPVSALVFSCSRDHVSDVWVNGNHLVKKGQLSSVNTPNLVATANKWAERISTIK